MINIVTWRCGAMGAIMYTLYGHDRDIFMTSKPIKISKFIWIMLIVLEPAYTQGTSFHTTETLKN